MKEKTVELAIPVNERDHVIGLAGPPVTVVSCRASYCGSNCFYRVSPFGQVVIEFSLRLPSTRIELPTRSTSKTDSVCLTLAGEWPTKFPMPATKYATEPATAPNVL